MFKNVAVSVLVILILGAVTLGGLTWCTEHCGWETGTCN